MKRGFDDYPDYVKEAQARFAALGIAANDASVFFPADPERFKFIDFEIES